MSHSGKPRTANTQDLELYLATLRSHLEPTPILKTLPTALQIFAHFQLLSRRIVEQAIHALDIQEDISVELQDAGVEITEWVARGALSRSEGKRVKKWSRRGEDDMMLGLSLEVRKHHIAKILSSISIVPKNSLRLINCYFPDLNSVDQQDHEMLFIRSMNSDEFGVLSEYRKIVMGWYRAAEKRYEKNRSPPTLTSMVGEFPVERFQGLVTKMIREAERCVLDAQDFEEMFQENIIGSDTEDVIAKEEQVSPVRRESVEAEKVDRLEDELAISRAKRRKTLPAQILPDSSNYRSRPRSSLPSHLRRSPSPTPEHLASLPRVNFGKHPTVTRFSLDRSTTPASPIIQQSTFTIPQPEPLFDASPSSDIETTQHVNGAGPSTTPGPPPIYALPEPPTASSPLNGSSITSPSPKNIKGKPKETSATKKPKRISGLPPDFFAPLPKASHSPKELKPFSTAELQAGKRKSLLSESMQIQTNVSVKLDKGKRKAEVAPGEDVP